MAASRLSRQFRIPVSAKRPILRALLFSTPLAILLCATFSRRQAARNHPHGLLWLTPRTGGFNNQLITIYEAIRCAQLRGRTVVLPLIFENVRADTSSKGFGPYPLEDYFDVEELRKIVPVTTLRDLDRTGVPCRTIFFATSTHFKANERRIPRLLKQQYVKRYPLNLSFVDKEDFGNFEHELCVDDSFCPLPSEFGIYSDYKLAGQGYNIRKAPILKAIRMAFKPGAVVKTISQHILDSIGGPFNAMHIRRGDFETKCDELPLVCEEYGNNSFVQAPEWILEKAANFRDPTLPLFLSTTHPDECRELFKERNVKLIFMDDYEIPVELSWATERTDIISYASQIVVSHADGFIGNRFSSFTTEINNMRYLRNPKDTMRFF